MTHVIPKAVTIVIPLSRMHFILKRVGQCDMVKHDGTHGKVLPLEIPMQYHSLIKSYKQG